MHLNLVEFAQGLSIIGIMMNTLQVIIIIIITYF